MNFRGYDSWKQDDPADSELGTCREATPNTFSGWGEAFDVCRDRNAPMVVTVDGERLKIYPSGSYKRLANRCAQCNAEIADGRRWCRGCADQEVEHDGISAETANRRLAAIIDD